MFQLPINLRRFKTANDEEGEKESGLSPLAMASLSGNAEVVRTLVSEHKVDVHVPTRDVNSLTGFDIGCTPLHACMTFCTAGHADMLTLLLNAGADINAQSKSGM
jgi:hypothetical protein